jgi:hypothetical protein
MFYTNPTQRGPVSKAGRESTAKSRVFSKKYAERQRCEGKFKKY